MKSSNGLGLIVILALAAPLMAQSRPDDDAPTRIAANQHGSAPAENALTSFSLRGPTGARSNPGTMRFDPTFRLAKQQIRSGRSCGGRCVPK